MTGHRMGDGPQGRALADGAEDDEDGVRVERAPREGARARLRIFGRGSDEGSVLEHAAALGDLGALGRQGQRLAAAKVGTEQKRNSIIQSRNA